MKHRHRSLRKLPVSFQAKLNQSAAAWASVSPFPTRPASYFSELLIEVNLVLSWGPIP